MPVQGECVRAALGGVEERVDEIPLSSPRAPLLPHWEDTLALETTLPSETWNQLECASFRDIS